MPEFQCSNCRYTSYLKVNVQKHVNKKKKCTDCEIVPNIIELKNIIISCDYCNKTISTKPNLSKHLKICKIKKIELERQLQEKEEQVQELEKKLAIAEGINKRPSIGTQNNFNNININLAPWNNPVIPKDIEKYYKEAVKKIFLAIPTLIKFIHFNADHPENHNICIRNARSKVAKVYNGKEWESMDEDLLIKSLINDYEATLEDYAEEKSLSYVNKMNAIKDRDTEEKVYDDLQVEVKRVIYDRNHMVRINKN